MYDSDEFLEYELPRDSDPLDPSIASANDPDEEDDDSEIISNMTYSDYLSAVYSFDDKAYDKARYDKKIIPLEQQRDSKLAMLKALEQSALDNRSQQRKLHDDAIEEQKKNWQKTQDNLDVLIAQEVFRAKHMAFANVNKKKEEYIEERDQYNNKVNNLKDDLLRLDNELKEINIYRNKFDDYTIETSPVEDESVMELLETAKEKRWLTAYHRELLQRDANDVCEKRVDTFEQLAELERDFANSKMVEDIRAGEVTREVIEEFSKRAAVMCAAVVALMATIAAANPSLVFFCCFQAAASSLMFGGVSLDVGHRLLKKKFPKKKERSKVNLLSLFAGFLGGSVGFLIWAAFIAGVQNLFVFVYTLLASAATGFLFRQILLRPLPERLLKRIPFLQNRARYFVFKNNLKVENGKRNLQIYCCLNRPLVLHYLTIKHIEDINADIENRIKRNRELYKKDRQQLAALAPRRKVILEKQREFNEYVEQRKDELSREIKSIEARRGDTESIDFESKLPQNVSSELIRLDAEYEDIQVQIEDTALALKRAEEHLSSARKKYGEAAKEYALVEEALRYWYKTPTPSATDYSLLDSLCFESKNQLSIIRHNLKPFAFRYTVRHKESSPSESVKVMIFKYIRGLIKINPCRMIQVNIIDPVSDPKILMNDDRFKRLSPMGVIGGVYSVSDFEIRLFSSERSYNTFRSIFKTQCIEIQRVLSANKDKIDEGEPYSLELANRIKNNENEPFMYQVMMFIVPRAFDRTSFEPPHEIVKAIENGTYLNMGLLPVFFVDDESVHKDWRSVVDRCPEECIVRKK